LKEIYGEIEWWKGNEFEICIGAILAPQTKWIKVEEALENLKKNGLLNPEALSKADVERVRELIKSVNFNRQKAERIISFAEFYIQNRDSIKQLPLEEARKLLLRLKGVGEETADSILLYAFNRPSFVIDAYTMRILECLDINAKKYREAKKLFEEAIDADARQYQLFHALIDEYAKQYCNKKTCSECRIKLI
jgi:endonuclease-3 related protein